MATIRDQTRSGNRLRFIFITEKTWFSAWHHVFVILVYSGGTAIRDQTRSGNRLQARPGQQNNPLFRVAQSCFRDTAIRDQTRSGNRLQARLRQHVLPLPSFFPPEACAKRVLPSLLPPLLPQKLAQNMFLPSRPPEALSQSWQRLAIVAFSENTTNWSMKELQSLKTPWQQHFEGLRAPWQRQIIFWSLKVPWSKLF